MTNALFTFHPLPELFMNKKIATAPAASFLFALFIVLGVTPHRLHAQPRAAALAHDNQLKHVLAFSGQEQVTMPAFMQNYREALGLTGNDELKPLEVAGDELGITHHRLQQYHRGLEIADRSFLVHEKDGKVYLAHGDIVAGLQIETAPALSEQQALRLALDHIGAQAYMWEDPGNEAFLQREQNDPAATFFPKGQLLVSAGHEARAAGDFHLAYRFDLYAEKPLGRYAVDVDAKTGAIIKASSLMPDADVAGQGASVYNGQVQMTVDQLNSFSYRLRQSGRGKGIETYDMRHGTNIGAAVDFLNADTNFISANARAGVSAHWALEATYDYFKNVHNRDSYDNGGGKMLAYVHYGNAWFNASWDGTRMRFGDGNNNATPLVTIDIVAHELTHGVTGNSARLIYAAESGALNESFSDIFGNAVEFAVLDTNGSWDIGEGAVRIRSMANPRRFGDPNTYLGRGWASTAPGSADNGGVHTNSGVQNYWFYLLSEGGSGVNDNGDAYNVAGLGFAEAEKIAYRNLTRYLTQSSGYFEARLATIYATTDLYGANSPQYETGLAAWEAVGVYYPKQAATLIADADTLGFLAEASVSRDTSTLVIVNRGLDNLVLSNFQATGAGFQLLSPPSAPVTLSYGNSLVLRVLFTPASANVVFGAVTMSSNDPLRLTHTVTLRGKGFAIRPASADLIYANAGRSSNGVLLTIDPANGRGAAVGATNYEELTGVALRPSNNLIYGTVATSLATTLVRVDAQTGEAYPLVSVPVGNMRAIAFDRNDDLFGAQFTTGKIYRIVLATGDTAAVGNTKLTLLSGLAINPLNGALWCSRATGQALYTIDKATAATTLVGNTGINAIADLEFDAAGNLFGLAGFGANVVSDFVQINPTTAKAVKIGSTSFKSAYSLVVRGAIVTEVAEAARESSPKIFALAQNHPNPFNPSTVISFQLSVNSHATLKVFDLAGREVATLVSGKLAAGAHEARFDASALAAGVYVYRLEAGEHIATRKLLLVK
jgi:Zn-dependent metalloprotease